MFSLHVLLTQACLLASTRAQTSTWTGAPITILETSKALTDATPSVATITTTASLSISVPPASATDANYTFVLQPELRTNIEVYVEGFCNDTDFGAYLDNAPGTITCNMVAENSPNFVDGFYDLVDDDVIIDGGYLDPFYAPPILGQAVFNHYSGSLGSLDLSLLVPLEVVQSYAPEPVSATVTSSSPAAPALSGHWPNGPTTTVAISDIAALTQYWESFFAASLTTSSTTIGTICTHGADPGLYTGTAGYCQCPDGKLYPVSPVTATTTISGTSTNVVSDCPYTAIPSSTVDLGPTKSPVQSVFVTVSTIWTSTTLTQPQNTGVWGVASLTTFTTTIEPTTAADTGSLVRRDQTRIDVFPPI